MDRSFNGTCQAYRRMYARVAASCRQTSTTSRETRRKSVDRDFATRSARNYTPCSCCSNHQSTKQELPHSAAGGRLAIIAVVVSAPNTISTSSPLGDQMPEPRSITGRAPCSIFSVTLTYQAPSTVETCRRWVYPATNPDMPACACTPAKSGCASLPGPSLPHTRERAHLASLLDSRGTSKNISRDSAGRLTGWCVNNIIIARGL